MSRKSFRTLLAKPLQFLNCPLSPKAYFVPMETSLKVTTDYQIIQAWAQKYHGRPQRVNEGGVTFIRIDFPGKQDDNFLSDNKPRPYISWGEFFRIFKEDDLAFIFEDRDVTDPSLAYHFIKRENLDEDEVIDERIFG